MYAEIEEEKLTIKYFIMKKILILGSFLLVATVSIASQTELLINSDTISAGTECPMGCETASPKCCSTKGGSAYYGKL